MSSSSSSSHRDGHRAEPVVRHGAAVLDSAAILRHLPHRYPFLLVDRIVEIEPRRRIVGLKNVTISEPFFQGHFPDHPIMPGVLIIEAMAQVGAILPFSEGGGNDGKLVFFLGIDKARFRKPVAPGDQLRIEMTVLQIREPHWRMQGMAYVADQLVCEAELRAMITERQQDGQDG